MRLRNRLYDAVGLPRALACLARYYPQGSVKEEIERRKAVAEERGEGLGNRPAGRASQSCLSRQEARKGKEAWADRTHDIEESIFRELMEKISLCPTGQD